VSKAGDKPVETERPDPTKADDPFDPARPDPGRPGQPGDPSITTSPGADNPGVPGEDPVTIVLPPLDLSKVTPSGGPGVSRDMVFTPDTITHLLATPIKPPDTTGMPPQVAQQEIQDAQNREKLRLIGAALRGPATNPSAGAAKGASGADRVEPAARAAGARLGSLFEHQVERRALLLELDGDKEEKATAKTLRSAVTSLVEALDEWGELRKGSPDQATLIAKATGLQDEIGAARKSIEGIFNDPMNVDQAILTTFLDGISQQVGWQIAEHISGSSYAVAPELAGPAYSLRSTTGVYQGAMTAGSDLVKTAKIVTAARTWTDVTGKQVTITDRWAQPLQKACEDFAGAVKDYADSLQSEPPPGALPPQVALDNLAQAAAPLAQQLSIASQQLSTNPARGDLDRSQLAAITIYVANTCDRLAAQSSGKAATFKSAAVALRRGVKPEPVLQAVKRTDLSTFWTTARNALLASVQDTDDAAALKSNLSTANLGAALDTWSGLGKGLPANAAKYLPATYDVANGIARCRAVIDQSAAEAPDRRRAGDALDSLALTVAQYSLQYQALFSSVQW
jgi:hypothetical protein